MAQSPEPAQNQARQRERHPSAERCQVDARSLLLGAEILEFTVERKKGPAIRRLMEEELQHDRHTQALGPAPPLRKLPDSCQQEGWLRASAGIGPFAEQPGPFHVGDCSTSARKDRRVNR